MGKRMIVVRVKTHFNIHVENTAKIQN